ncbi:hypothetical protein IIA79_00705 [bacterium]|nr:hypothetical protein [bacterium]
MVELITLKEILVETAKELWRQKNPDRQRLPAGFETSIEIKMYEIRGGSVSVPLVRCDERPDGLLPFDEELDELDEAALLVAESATSAAESRLVPDTMPKRVLSMFSKLGRSLREGEYFEFLPAGQQTPSRYDKRVGELLSQWQPTEYEDTVLIVGEIRAADLDGHRFKIRLEDGRKIEGEFSPDREAMITEALRQHETQRLKLKVRVVYDAITQRINRISEVEDYWLHLPEDEKFDASAKPIWEIAAEIAGEVPTEEWDRVPTDLSKYFDEYHHGKNRVDT